MTCINIHPPIRRVGDRRAKFELEPVSSVSCLASEGKSRLVVGAGAEITIEQWGSDKLVQIGFYHCYMQVCTGYCHIQEFLALV